MLSNARIDKAGRSLVEAGELTEEGIKLEDVFDAYRAAHLEPLSKTTLELQQWLQTYGGNYYIAQRLKRKPQIIRKLKRLSVRLTQLQDIGGCRIIVDHNHDVDKLLLYLKQEISNQTGFKISRTTDYRAKGRDNTGYRALHVILERDGRKLELQIRSRIQHYWSESIERTSVIYGYHLKEEEGDPVVLSYFKTLSNMFYEMESGREPSRQQKVTLDTLRIEAESIIAKHDKNRASDSYVNEDVIKTLVAKEGNTKTLQNWLIVFDWNIGNFVTWDSVGRDSEEAIKKYVSYEKQFTTEANYEVVMIGSSDISSVRKTHSHYFGIKPYENILESLDESILGFSSRMDIDVGARQILAVLVRRKCWGNKAIKIDTLKNHMLKNMITFDSSLRILKEKDLIRMDDSQSPVSLNVKKKPEIEKYV